MAAMIALDNVTGVEGNVDAAARVGFPSSDTSSSADMSSDKVQDNEAQSMGESKRHLPFEIRALEATLLTAVAILGREVSSLEAAARPLLTRIRHRIERQDLESLFEVQSKLDKAVSRVSRIREVLEEILDDEDEMAAMCLSHAEAGNDVGASPRVIGGRQFTIDEEYPTTGTDIDEEEVSEVQDLFEAHWLQSDYLLSRLTSMQQNISRTQHLVNLDLDSKRNALVALGLVS